MNKLTASLLVLALPVGAPAAEPDVKVEIRTLHLRPASDIVMTYQAVCGEVTYTLKSNMSAVDRRPTAIVALVVGGADQRKVDVAATELGRLMMDRTGFGELGFACGADRLFIRYVGATQATETSPPVVQDALFNISKDGVVSRAQPSGITVTPLEPR